MDELSLSQNIIELLKTDIKKDGIIFGQIEYNLFLNIKNVKEALDLINEHKEIYNLLVLKSNLDNQLDIGYFEEKIMKDRAKDLFICHNGKKYYYDENLMFYEIN